MAATILEKRYTKQDVLDLPDAVQYELVDGIPTERPVSWETSAIAVEVSSVLRNFVRPLRLGVIAGSDNTLDIFPNRPDHFRRADVSFTRQERVPGGRPDKGDQEVPPDLVVEVVSPNERAYTLEEKVQEYLDAGVRLIWVIYPNLRCVDVIRPGRPKARLLSTDSLDGEDILPGFSHPVASLFDI